MKRYLRITTVRRPIAALAAAILLAGTATAAQQYASPPREHEFYFTRGIYDSGIGNLSWGPRWAIDFPKADQQFLIALKRLTLVDAPDEHHALELGREALRDFPFVYALEVGSLSLNDAQARALRDYLLAGGFLVIDDFWGSWAWDNLEKQLRRVFPEYGIEEVPLEHPVFNAFYDIREIVQVPNIGRAAGGPTYELDGRVPHVRGIFDKQGRLMVLINWNTDLGDGWEWADSARYPLKYSTYAYKMGINFVIYAMTH